MKTPAERDKGHDLSARSWLIALVGVVAGLAVTLAMPDSGPGGQADVMAGVTVIMAVWWITEVVPIAVTALLPLVLLPAFEIASLDAVAGNYGKGTIFLFLGGFLLALALQRADLHRRIALRILVLVGDRPARVVLGFMLSTALLSMWISNTATVMVMMPIGLAVLSETGERLDATLQRRLGVALMLGIAYAADIGGMATPVGTPPNLVFIEVFQTLYPDAPAVGFGPWMLMGLPLAVTFLAIGWPVLTKLVFRLPSERIFGESSVVERSLEELGPIRRDEIVTGGVFATTALLWMTGSDLSLGEQLTLPGWRTLTGLEALGDGAVAIGAAILLFLLPSEDRPGRALLDWETALGVPWGILLLFGGGFALADGFKISGLSELIGSGLATLAGLPVLGVVIIVCVVLTFLTEVTSNTATTTLVLPIIANASVALGFDPRVLMIPATLSASCAFMMPVASPTQAIVVGSGYVPIKEMARAGIWFNLIGVCIVTAIFFFIAVPIFGIDLSELPVWAAAR